MILLPKVLFSEFLFFDKYLCVTENTFEQLRGSLFINNTLLLYGEWWNWSVLCNFSEGKLMHTFVYYVRPYLFWSRRKLLLPEELCFFAWLGLGLFHSTLILWCPKPDTTVFQLLIMTSTNVIIYWFTLFVIY